MKKLSTQEFSRNTEYIKREILSDLKLLTPLKKSKKRYVISCDVILNNTLYELYIYENIDKYLELQGTRSLDLLKELFSENKQRILLVPKQFKTFEEDFYEVIKIDYEVDTGYSLNTMKKESSLMTFNSYSLINGNLYTKSKKALMYAYSVINERLDNGHELQEEYVLNGMDRSSLINIEGIKNFRHVLNNTIYIGEIFRTHTETTSKKLFGGKTDVDQNITFEEQEESNMSTFELLYINSKIKGKKYLKESC